MCSLGFHYHKSNQRRHLAFKYKVKAADQAISRGAFSDGLRFTQAAAELAESKPELAMLLKVISIAIRDIASIGGVPQRRNSGSFVAGVGSSPMSLSTNNNNPQTRSQGLRSEYLKLKIAMEAKLEKLSKGHVKAEEASPGNKNRLVISKQPSARLTWQPSYLASKQDDSSSDDDSSEEDKVEKKKSACIVS